MSNLKEAQLENSDSDDPDFDPDFEAAKEVDEKSSSDSDDCISEKEEDEEEDEVSPKTSKTSKSKTRGRRKKNKTKEEVKEVPKNDKIAENNEETSKKADSLWASFKSDVSSNDKSKNGAITDDNKLKKTELNCSEVGNSEKPSASNKRSEKISPPKPAGSTKRPGGLSSILSQLGKKPKVGILESSKLEWNKFKKEENIEEELSQINRGKKGYLEKQDFLQRTDLRQFEIEKKLRSVNRRSLN